ncbi:MAG TPA: FAD/NAD(P)-binding oxidoreductase [Gaiellaceae bacterium]|nr:FAD/NAD(P)-binding oxidoreductase [Gaiellaceae bacterium]
MSGRTLILGGGFGGIAAAVELRRLLGDRHEVVLVDRKPEFAMGLRKLWELVGRGSIADGSRSRALLARHGVEFVQTEIEAIDPGDRRVETSGGPLEGDRLVIALGAVSRPDLVPGLAEHGHDVWSFAGVPAAAEALRAFGGGRIVVLVAGAPYPCPPAPYECLFHLHEHLLARGLRERTELSVATLQPMLMPNAGREGSEWMGRQLAEHGISQRPGAKTERVEPGRVVLADGEIPFDLLIAVPPHRPPAVVADSGLAAAHGWIAVDAGTLATDHEGVYAVGDVTLIPLASGLPLPKAGVMAELHGTRVARAIAAELRGGEAPAPFDGSGFCPVEIGSDAAALVQGHWYAEPEPVVTITGPSAAHAAEKAAFETEHLEHWFGS